MAPERPSPPAETQMQPLTPYSPDDPAPAVWNNGVPQSLPCRFGRYELLKVLGRGGMGFVYLAHDAQLDRLVALKTPQLGGPERFHLADRFLREAQVAATLAHPNLCPVYDCGEVGGVLFLTMAYVEGKPLSRFLKPGQPLPPRPVVAVVRHLAQAMQIAHDSGVIHRDLKPSNIMITPSKQPVIMDFGLARRTGADDPQLTLSGQLMGTPIYMAPEQVNGDTRAMGPASDVYSLGVILYELLAGRPPFQGPLGDLMARIMTEPPPPIARSRPEIDPALDALCRKALAKAPAERFASMKAFAESLGDYLRGRLRTAHLDFDGEPTYTLANAQGDAPLDQVDAASLFQVMAARPAGRSSGSQRRRRRVRFRLPEWVLPISAGVLAIAAIGWGLSAVFSRLDGRFRKWAPAAAAKALDPAQIADEQRRQAEQQRLESHLATLKSSPSDTASRRELDSWLDSDSGRRSDLPPELNLALGCYLLCDRDRWDAGLHRLLLTGDGPWRNAARLDVAAATDDSLWPCIRAGDTWWSLADTVPDGKRLRDRAGFWYRRALDRGSLPEAEQRRLRGRLS